MMLTPKQHTQHHLARDEGCEDGDDGKGDQLHHQVSDESMTRLNPRIYSRKRADFKLVKKRGIVPDGLVQRRLDTFLTPFPNLRGWGGDSQAGKGGVGQTCKLWCILVS